MKILICVDSYKGTLSSVKVTEIITGILRTKGFKVLPVPVGDGGEGTLDALLYSLGGRKQILRVKNPVGKNINAYYGIINKTAFIEMAKSSGLILLRKSELNPLTASTFGFGQLIKHAIERGTKKIYLALGGSATNDFGAGMLQALGVRFFDKAGREITGSKDNGLGGGVLNEIYNLDLKEFKLLTKNIEFEVLCDVVNPLFGKEGTTNIYSQQKGASPDMVKELEKGVRHFHKVIKKNLGIDVNFKGAGAAGGLGAALKVFMNAKITKGIEGMIKLLDIEKAVKNSDVVIVGEGSMDSQSAYGKAPIGIAELAKKYKKKVIAVNGRTDESASVFLGNQIDEIYSCFGSAKHKLSYLKKNAEKKLMFVTYKLSENLINF